MNHRNLMQNRRKEVQVNRGDELSLTNPVDGLYFEELLSCSAQDSMIAFCLEGTTHPFINIIPKVNTNLYRTEEAFLQYIAADGTAAGTPSTATVADPCEPANSFENGFVRWVCEGFTRLRRSTPVRDITDKNMKYCETIPIWDIAGNRISDDFEWDTFRLGIVMLQDFHDAFLLSNDANAGETNGLLATIDYGYTDPVTGIAHPEMDSWVFDWQGNSVCDFENGAAGVTLNGIALAATVTDNLTLISLLRSYTRRVAQLIDNASVSGSYNFVALAEDTLIQCIIDCWVCEVRCSRDVVRMDNNESNAALERLHAQLGSTGAVTLSFDGHNITFVSWSRNGLYDEATGLHTLVVLVPRIGNYNAWELQFKDMGSAISGLKLDYKSWMTTDSGRWLHWSQIDHTCYQLHTELQYRLCARARWTAIKIENIACETDAFGRFSCDPSLAAAPSGAYLGRDYTGGYALDPANTHIPFVLRD